MTYVKVMQKGFLAVLFRCFLFVSFLCYVFASGVILFTLIHEGRRALTMETLGLGLFCISVTILLPLVMRGGLSSLNANRQNQLFRNPIGAFATFLFIVGVVVTLGSKLAQPETWKSLQDAYTNFSVLFGPRSTIVNTLILALVGYILFKIKTHALGLYAYGEITFALTSCYVTVQKTKYELNANTATVVFAATYLVVRGLENRKKAIEGHP